jgi:hypothetical protein
MVLATLNVRHWKGVLDGSWEAARVTVKVMCLHPGNGGSCKTDSKAMISNSTRSSNQISIRRLLEV